MQLSLQDGSLGQAFHITPPPEHDIALGDLFRMIRRQGYALAEVSYKKWLAAVNQACAADQDHTLASLLSLFREPAYRGLTNAEIYQHTPAYDCRNTQTELAGSGVEFTPIGAEQVRASLAFYRRANLLPPAAAPGAKRIANASPASALAYQPAAALSPA